MVANEEMYRDLQKKCEECADAFALICHRPEDKERGGVTANLFVTYDELAWIKSIVDLHLHEEHIVAEVADEYKKA